METHEFETVEALLEWQQVCDDLTRQLNESREQWEAQNQMLIEDVEKAKQRLAEYRNDFNLEVLAAFDDTGNKKFCDGRVTVRETKAVVWHDKEQVAADVQERFPGWMIPDWKRVTKAIKNGDAIAGAGLELKPSVAVNVEKWAIEEPTK